MRLISRKSTLYTEMVTANALLHSDNFHNLLEADFEIENPVVLQIGGSNPQDVGEAAHIGYKYGYREFNLNCGCPSEKVSGAGCFGAILMSKPNLVAQCTSSIAQKTGIQASVKCRIGIDDSDSYEYLSNFIDIVSREGEVSHFIIHARKAILGAKFTPEQNRKIPPLKYDYVYKLVKDFPHLRFTINGGIESMEMASEQFSQGVHGVMVGRGVINNPYQWRDVDRLFYANDTSANTPLSRRAILTQYADYATRVEEGISSTSTRSKLVRRLLVRPLFPLFYSEPNGKTFRRVLDENLLSSNNFPVGDIILRAADCITEDVLDKI
jgi:tRNA-dihydrouridine synthase A